MRFKIGIHDTCLFKYRLPVRKKYHVKNMIALRKRGELEHFDVNSKSPLPKYNCTLTIFRVFEYWQFTK